MYRREFRDRSAIRRGGVGYIDEDGAQANMSGDDAGM